MRSRRRIPDRQLQRLVRRLLRIHTPDTDTPIIISTREGDHRSSVGRMLGRGGAHVSAVVDRALQRERAVTVFLPDNAYIGEVVSCAANGRQFAVELLLIQYQNDN